MNDLLLKDLELLAEKLQPRDIPLFLGGGLGIHLRTRELLSSGVRTLHPVLEPRSTSDIDVFLSTDVIINPRSTKSFREVLDELGYRSVQGAEHYQFSKDVEIDGRTLTLKIDLLAPPPVDETGLDKVKIDDRRIRPKYSRGLHAHVCPEAFLLEEDPFSISLSSPDTAIYVPNPLCLIGLKTAALRDQCDRPEKGYGRHHAFDIYLLVRSTTEADWGVARKIRRKYADDKRFDHFKSKVEFLFSDESSIGSIRLQEHAREVSIDLEDYTLTDFLEDIGEFSGVDGLGNPE